ncbi:MAG TPA: hypothetical protein VKG44_04675 [Candidatus Baltobacteraceae bacterium]|nr:hypothetical protein [Candidatus Baltobacteraceae bacterium]
MNHDATTASGTAADRPLRPATFEVPPLVKLMVLAGLALVLMQGSFVEAACAFGRVWPAADSAKIQLPPFKP